jgi:hypothetical protein
MQCARLCDVQRTDPDVIDSTVCRYNASRWSAAEQIECDDTALSDMRVRSVKPVGRFGEGRRESRCTRSLLESRTTREVVTSPRAIVDAGVYQPLCSGILCEPDK